MAPISIEDLIRLPPMIFGIIRWRRSVGIPAGDWCAGFDIHLEEHTATQYRDAGGGDLEPIPGTGIWKIVQEPISCRPLPDQGDHHVVSFQVTGLHVNAPLDGAYRVTPRLKGAWRPSGILAVGYRIIEPVSISVQLRKDAPLGSVEFEVVRRSWLFGRRL